MTDLERSIHAQVTHIGAVQRAALLAVDRGETIRKQTAYSLESRGWIRDVGHHRWLLTDDGTVAVGIIQEEYT